jgi:hypothetical protein
MNGLLCYTINGLLIIFITLTLVNVGLKILLIILALVSIVRRKIFLTLTPINIELRIVFSIMVVAPDIATTYKN